MPGDTLYVIILIAIRLVIYSSTNLPKRKHICKNDFKAPDFGFGWKNIIDLKLTDEEKIYKPMGCLCRSFKMHSIVNRFGEWAEQYA